MKFIKMHGLGNDFIIVDLRRGGEVPPRDVVGALTDRRRGIGCDQFIPLLPPKDPKADCFMRIMNSPDGSEAEACGNATRCVASLLMQEMNKDEVVIQTVAGLLHCRAENAARDIITVDMGIPRFDWASIPLVRDVDTLHMRIGEGDVYGPVAVNIGNPHAVFFVDDAEKVDVARLGPIFETNPMFPQKANIEFAQVLDEARIRMRVWERNTGITQACGSAACATAVAGVRRGLTHRRSEVILDGGSLHFDWREADDHLLMKGPATYVFAGEVRI